MSDHQEFKDEQFWLGFSWAILAMNAIRIWSLIERPEQPYSMEFQALNSSYLMYCAGRVLSRDERDEVGFGLVLAAIVVFVFSPNFHELEQQHYIHIAVFIGIGISLFKCLKARAHVKEKL